MLQYVVAPAQLCDIPEMVRIEFAAYANSPLAKVLRARDPQNAMHIAQARRKYAQMMHSGGYDEVQHFLKVVDDSDSATEPALLGWMRYEELRSGRPRPFLSAVESMPIEEIKSAPALDLPRQNKMIEAYNASIAQQYELQMPGQMPHMRRWLASLLWSCERDIDSWTDLALLVVDPAHQRRGVGAALLHAFLKVCDAARLPAYLMSSPEARRLYEANGFVVRQQLVFDARKFGRDEQRVQMSMVRGPPLP